ncbi:hypothetical protein DEU56DRAFT_760666 [Suillus clintonianus]|uniref:uncharacterized protein n=1 Tax=Suillus clintonianus TaxID=1904413 RepID=UPI001B85E21B|nr:uncharacterized protein DEU56DRAFT_760666 [Suillus clintonianus]KAG2121488.1 hypothetical protein DEU56DRAFT_760666 [Suillus clintonianus]
MYVGVVRFGAAPPLPRTGQSMLGQYCSGGVAAGALSSGGYICIRLCHDPARTAGFGFWGICFVYSANRLAFVSSYEGTIPTYVGVVRFGAAPPLPRTGQSMLGQYCSGGVAAGASISGEYLYLRQFQGLPALDSGDILTFATPIV